MSKVGKPYKLGLLAAVSFSCLSMTGVAAAQEDGADEVEATRSLDTIFVEARKRDESLQDVPVVVTAYNAEQIRQFGITDIDDLMDLTPSLIGYASASSTQNGLFALRGVFSGPLNFGSDQTVVTNIDGIQLSGGGAGLAGQVDIEQVEILKGPQVLFFGKNATGGVISYRTADPTDELFMQARAAYEFNAEEAIGEFIISGPISDTLGGRFVINVTDMGGWVENTFPGTNEPMLPNYTEVFTRGTLLWEPSDTFSARLKLSYSDREGGHMPIFQRTNCAVPRANDTCELDDEIFIPPPRGNNNISPFPNPNFRAVGLDYSHDISATIASLELNYELSPNLEFASLTGFYDVSRAGFNIGTPNLLVSDTSPAPGFIVENDAFESRNSFYQNALSQEFRLTSSYDQPLNFMVGLFFEDGFRSQYSEFDVDPNAGTLSIGNETVSAFGELVYEVSETVEISGGLRYSRETRDFDGFANSTVGFDPVTFAPVLLFDVPVNPDRDERTFENTSPELTLTWRPTDDLTAFVAYKEGFKSGSFDTSPLNYTGILLNPAQDLSFDDETVEGFEAGIKSEWYNNTLRLNASLYAYEYTDLQLVQIDGVGAAITTFIQNVGSADVQGLELEALWLPPHVDGLTIQGALNYNDTEIADYVTDCNTSQVVFGAPGCDVDLDPTTPGFEGQDVTGNSLPFAPEWSGSISASVDRPFGEGELRYRGNINGVYSGSYDADTGAQGDPLNEQDSYFITNLGFGIYNDDRGWAVDLIGRNVFDEFYGTTISDNPLSILDPERVVTANRGRQVMLQLTVRPTDFFSN